MDNLHPTVLIVDDQPENLVVLGALLEPHYRILVANSGEQALRLCLASPQPDLILLDVMMPEVDGYAVLSRLQANPATERIPVIFVTARDATEDEEQGLEAGAADYIVKPIKPALVLARVRTQLENKRARDLLRNQNAYLEAEVARRMHAGEIVQNASLAALAILAETRDTETGNHIYRTQGYVELLARELQQKGHYAEELGAAELSLYVKAAPLHDIGKVGIPDDILHKPGVLTKEEFSIMKNHAQIGGDAIAKAMRQVGEADSSLFMTDTSPLAFLETARQIAQSHHERWDGSGYPDGLSGLDIPLPARIMAVADVFDAITSRRVYKEAMPVSQAIDIILSERSKHFDPLIVDAFAEVSHQFVEIVRRYSALSMEVAASH
ncbi:MAG TPA: HD domain-containing phosphohydrolase [Rhodocyclaceae bacterium]|jgi:putative two-component system response regulator